jgi:PKD repeat protein
VITVIVTETGGTPRLGATNIFTVVVREVNTAPVLPVITERTINEGEALTFAIAATDADLPANQLTFSLINPPPGAAIDPVTGQFVWTPAEGQGPSVNVIQVRASDDGIPSLSATNNFTVAVQEVNTAPELIRVDDRVIDELSTLVVTNLATDADLPANTLSYELIAAPEGARLNPNSGLLTWTPTEAQGPSANIIIVKVSDSGIPSLSATNRFAVLVNEANAAPVLSLPTEITIQEGSPLSFVVMASDADSPYNKLTFSLINAPDGAAIEPDTGRFTWTPGETQGPSTNSVTVRVADDGAPSLSDIKTFIVMVTEQNIAPALAAIADQTVSEGLPLLFTATATDADLPLQALTFSLEGEAPEGARINPTSGVFFWKPVERQGPSTNVITVKVSDNGSPSLSDTKSFTVIIYEVNTVPVIAPIDDRVVFEEMTLTLTVTVTDTDVPAQAVTFSLEAGAPAGASVDPVTGAFRWRPSEAQGPSTNTIVIRVADDGEPSLSSTRAFTIVVQELDTAPVLPAIEDRTINEGEMLAFEASAEDADLPANVLTFSLSEAPEGAAIEAATGRFTWTPTEAQGPSTNLIAVKVSDDSPSSLSATNSVMVIVREVNAPPVLGEIGDKTVDEKTLLTFTAVASDADVPPQQLVYSLAPGAPAGSSINPTNGVFTWIPTAAQAATTNIITITVADDGTPSLSDAKTFTVTVAKVYIAPTITAPPEDQTVTLGGSAFFGVAAAGTLPLGYQWQFNGTPIPGATNSTLILTNVQLIHDGSYAVVVSNITGSVTSPPAALTVVGLASLWGQVTDATNGLALSGVLVAVQGQAAVTDVEGNYFFAGLSGGLKADFDADNQAGEVPLTVHFTNTTTHTELAVHASKLGYHPYTNALVQLQPGQTNRLDFSLSPIESGRLRLVLNWGQNPKDLDIHLLTPAIEGTSYDVNWGEKGSLTSIPFVQLDVDNRNGFGPETVTIARGYAGLYHCYVQNFGDEWMPPTAELTNSAAVVQIYSEAGLADTFHVPVTGQGRYWHVCTIDGITRAISPINKITETADLPAPAVATLRDGTPTLNAAGKDRSLSAFHAQGAGARYRWDFGDGTMSTLEHPVKVYSAPGNYTVSLQVTTPDKWADMAIKPNYIIVALPTPVLSISRSGPNVAIKWAAAKPGFSLETKADLNDSNWATVTQPPMVTGATYTVTLPIQGNHFFRLRKP